MGSIHYQWYKSKICEHQKAWDRQLHYKAVSSSRHFVLIRSS